MKTNLGGIETSTREVLEFSHTSSLRRVCMARTNSSQVNSSLNLIMKGLEMIEKFSISGGV